MIDPKESRIVGRWAGREVKVKSIARAIQDFLGPPAWAAPPGTLSPEEREIFLGHVDVKGGELGSITSQVLSLDGDIPAEALSSFDRFYEANLSDEAIEDNALTRGQRVARGALMMEPGYEKLFASGRLSEAAKAAIRDRVLQIAEKDPSSSVRIFAAAALRKYIGQPADAALLEALRGLSEREQEPLVKASLDHALEDLGPNGAAKRREAALRPVARDIRRMLNEAPDPATSPWADAHAYGKGLSQRTNEQLMQDYAAFKDPPEDEVGRQNATLKRRAATSELEDRLRGGEMQDWRSAKDFFTRVMSEEPDPDIRKWAAWEALQAIAQRGGRDLRGEIIGILESRLSVESDRYVRATIDTTIQELKKP